MKTPKNYFTIYETIRNSGWFLWKFCIFCEISQRGNFKRERRGAKWVWYNFFAFHQIYAWHFSFILLNSCFDSSLCKLWMNRQINVSVTRYKYRAGTPEWTYINCVKQQNKTLRSSLRGKELTIEQWFLPIEVLKNWNIFLFGFSWLAYKQNPFSAPTFIDPGCALVCFPPPSLTWMISITSENVKLF